MPLGREEIVVVVLGGPLGAFTVELVLVIVIWRDIMQYTTIDHQVTKNWPHFAPIWHLVVCHVVSCCFRVCIISTFQTENPSWSAQLKEKKGSARAKNCNPCFCAERTTLVCHVMLCHMA